MGCDHGPNRFDAATCRPVVHEKSAQHLSGCGCKNRWKEGQKNFFWSRCPNLAINALSRKGHFQEAFFITLRREKVWKNCVNYSGIKVKPLWQGTSDRKGLPVWKQYFLFIRRFRHVYCLPSQTPNAVYFLHVIPPKHSNPRRTWTRHPMNPVSDFFYRIFRRIIDKFIIMVNASKCVMLAPFWSMP